MQAYKIEAKISNDGKIILPLFLKKLFNKTVEIIVLEKSIKAEKTHSFIIPSFTCGGKVSDFYREDLYGERL